MLSVIEKSYDHYSTYYDDSRANVCNCTAVLCTDDLCCLQGMGTDDRTLIRVVVSRCEVDMVQIKQEFQKRYGKTLESFVRVSKNIVFISNLRCKYYGKTLCSYLLG